MKSALALLATVFLVSISLSAQTSKLPTGSRIFISPMDSGLDGFIAPEIIKKKLAMKPVTDERDADCILAGASINSGRRQVVLHYFGGKDKNAGNIRLLRVKDKSDGLVW